MLSFKRLARSPLLVPALLGALFTLAVTRNRLIPGGAYENYGRAMSRHILTRPWRHYDLAPHAIDLLLSPVGVSRFFEFDFVARNLSTNSEQMLDISSPRLFSLYQASLRPSLQVTMSNPDTRDIAITQKLSHILGLKNVTTKNLAVSALAASNQKYDDVLSISVLEHIAGEDGDILAIKALAGMVRQGGRLIVTVPVDRSYVEEYRDEDTYGLQDKHDKASYLFERRYDLNALVERLVATVGAKTVHVKWAGEIRAGSWDRYINAWRRWGLVMRSMDRYIYSNHWKRFDSWNEMPGAGVCGIVFHF